MPRYVAFLRAINVGGRTVPMARLMELFEQLDCRDVTTFLASGNVIFTADARASRLEQQLDRHLEAELGHPAEAFVRTLPALAGVLAGVPWSDRELSESFALMIGFIRGRVNAASAAKVVELAGSTDRLVIDGGTLYWLRTVRESDPGLSAVIERTLGVPITVRNVNTVRRILARHGGSR